LKLTVKSFDLFLMTFEAHIFIWRKAQKQDQKTMPQANLQNVKIVIVGDGTVGKTCLLTVYMRNEFPNDYNATIFDNHSTNIIIDDKPIHMMLWDTAGQTEYDKLRPIAYRGTDIFLVCYSVVDVQSRENVIKKWVPEIRHHVPSAKILIVGTKTDLREDRHVVSKLKEKCHSPSYSSQGEHVAVTVGAIRYLECSAKNPSSVKTIFKESVRIAISSAEKTKSPVQQKEFEKKKKCSIL
jgi:small GTP-binding protein